MKKYYLLTPGPTPVPPRVAARTAEPIIHHRTKEFGELFDRVQEGMKYVMRTKNDVLMIMGSGTAAMEAAIANTCSSGDKVLVGSIGVFGDRFVDICEAYGLSPLVIREEWGTPLSPQKVEDALKKNPDIKIVTAQHTETSTTTVNDLKTIGAIVAKTHALFVVDSVSGLAAQELHMDDWKIDVLVSGSQKGLMCPPGLSMAAISEKGWKHVETAKLPRFYSDFRRIRKSIATHETPWTPAVSLFQGLDEAIKMIKEETLEGVWKRHQTLAKAVRAGFQAMGLKALSTYPCDVVTGAWLPDSVDGKAVIRKMLTDYGVSIAGGQKHLKGKIVRLAHMGYMDAFDMLIGLNAIENALSELGYKVPQAGQAVEAAKAALVS